MKKIKRDELLNILDNNNVTDKSGIESSNSPDVFKKLESHKKIQKVLKNLPSMKIDEKIALEKVYRKLSQRKKKHPSIFAGLTSHIRPLTAVAAAALIIFGGLFFLIQSSGNGAMPVVNEILYTSDNVYKTRVKIIKTSLIERDTEEIARGYEKIALVYQ